MSGQGAGNIKCRGEKGLDSIACGALSDVMGQSIMLLSHFHQMVQLVTSLLHWIVLLVISPLHLIVLLHLCSSDSVVLFILYYI